MAYPAGDNSGSEPDSPIHRSAIFHMSPMPPQTPKGPPRRPTPPRSKRNAQSSTFSWGAAATTGVKRNSGSSYESLTFPMRGDERAFSSPTLNELGRVPKPPRTPKVLRTRHTDAPSQSAYGRGLGSYSRSQSDERCPTGVLLASRTPPMHRSGSLMDIKTAAAATRAQLPRGVQTMRPLRTKAHVMSMLYRRKNRPPPLDLFEIVRIPQPVVGCPLSPEIADPSRRPDTVSWWRKEERRGEVTWAPVSEAWEYEPTQMDVGCVLRVVLMVNEKPYIDFSPPVLPHPHTPSPRSWKRAKRAEGTPRREAKRTAQRWRLLTWNTLADAAAGHGFGHKCPPWALSWHYRKGNLSKQLALYDADVVCLQEIDKKFWNSHWVDFFRRRGFEGEYAGSSKYGCAIFYRTAAFEKKSYSLINLDEVSARVQAAILGEGFGGVAAGACGSSGMGAVRGGVGEGMRTPIFPRDSSRLSALRGALRSGAQGAAKAPPGRSRLGRAGDMVAGATATSPASLRKRMHAELRALKCGRKALVFELERRGAGGGFRVFVATLHLYKSESRPHAFIRLLQIHHVMQRVAEMTRGADKARVIFAGDFNSDPDGAVCEFLRNGSVQHSHRELKACAILPEVLRHNFNLTSAYKEVIGHEQTYVRKQRDQTPVVEYIWYSAGVQPVAVIPIKPSHASRFAVEKLSSDHHPLVVDLVPS